MSENPQTIRALVDAGFDQLVVIDAVRADDFSRLLGRIRPGAFRRILTPPDWRDYSNCRG